MSFRCFAENSGVSIENLIEFHYETRPQTNFVIGSPRAGWTVLSKFVWQPSIAPAGGGWPKQERKASGLKPLEALLAWLSSGILQSQSPENPGCPPPPPPKFVWGPRVYRGRGRGAPQLKTVQHYIGTPLLNGPSIDFI